MKKIIGSITVFFGMFIAAMESLIGSTIMPSILSSLGGIHLYPLLASSFLLALVVTTPLFGKLSDRLGFTKVYLIAIFFFALGSMLCGTSRTMEELIISRFIQGVGSSGLITLCLIYVGIAFPLSIRHKMQAVISSMWVIASVVGPAAGTFFVSYLSWRWAFWINVPACFLIFLSTTLTLSHLPKDRHRHPFDVLGAIMFTFSSAGILYTLTEFGKLQFSTPLFLLFAFALTLLIFTIYDGQKKPHPFLDLSILKKEPTFIYALGIGFFTGAFLFTISNLLPLYIQGAQGNPISAVGTSVMGMVFGTCFGSMTAALILHKIGFRKNSLIGSSFIVLGIFALSFISLKTSPLHIAFANFITGTGIGMTANGAIVSTQFLSSPQNIGTNTSLFSFFRGVGGMLFISLIGSIQLTLFHHGNTFDPQELKIIFDPIERHQISPQSLLDFTKSLGSSIHISLLALLPFTFLHLYFSSKMPNTSPGKNE